MADDLIYFPDDKPGITRRRRGRGFSYHDASGKLICDPDERSRIASIAVPPDYDDVWISPEPRAHLQATGRDARGRKQYIYHKDWQARQAGRKFDSLANFGRALPRLRGAIASGLCAPAGSRQLALAAVLALLDRAALRVGNARYAKENKSYGATTLRNRHVRMDKGGIDIAYPGKRGQRVTVRLHGKRLQDALHKIHDLPGAALFTWLDDAGDTRILRSEDVNASLREICGDGASAKTFRTWNGTHAAFTVAARTQEALTISDMAEAAAERLQNSKTIARNSYIHPRVIALAELDPHERTVRLNSLKPPEISGLRAHEASLIALLESTAFGT